MSLLSRIFAGSEDRIVQHNHEFEEEEYTFNTLGKLQLESGDMIVVTVPEGQNQEYILERIRHTGDGLEKNLGWRPLVVAIPEGWSMGAISRDEVAEFCRNVLRALESK